MQEELPKNYDPQKSDTRWYHFYEEEGFFKAHTTTNKPTFCIVIPPPNVTGALHMGHALVNTLQDIQVRWMRMRGFETLWVPGTDHAGISTQTVVERHLIETEKKRRTDFSREEFLKYVFAWKDTYEARITNQLKQIGCSPDWERQRFTMDAGNNLAVRTMFKKLFDEGLIYRGDYLVNWDPVTETALADDEVEYEEKESFLWYIRYPVKDSDESIIIATTRPETMLGDTAVAVSSSDPRYKKYIGSKVILPLTGREIPVIADPHVDPSFGTGALKVTPAHDPNDYQMGLNHQLAFINIMTPSGKINEKGGSFQGLSMAEARKAIVKTLQEQGFLVKTEPHLHRVGISYRSKAVIEPYMSKQWFVKMSHFQSKMETAVKDGKVKIIPEQWENVYFHWIRNLRDWCISRQLWWGHQIPIWYNKENPEKIICFEGEGLPPEVAKNPDAWMQDPDVLDTWFSSALWPFATLGWPQKTKELELFYPNSMLITGHDILFFWVARMIMMGEYALGQVPFPKVYLHGLIFGKSYWRVNPQGGITYIPVDERRAYELGKPIPKDVESKWEKMSKSKGNIIDPLEIIQEYGTDAMRMALASSATSAREIDLDHRKFEDFRNFANKVWNGARFVLMSLYGNATYQQSALTAEEFSIGLGPLQLEDAWILSKLTSTIRTVNLHLENFAFDAASTAAYDFFWKEFCAYYVEIVKPVLFMKTSTPEDRKNKQKILAIVLLAALRLLHPMAPFITEELFSLLKKQLGSSTLGDTDTLTKEAITALHSKACMVAPYPTPLFKEDPKILETFAHLENIVYQLRNIRGEMKLSPATATDVHLIDHPVSLAHLEKHKSLITALVRVNHVHFHTSEPSLPFASTAVLGTLKIMVPLPEELLQNERKRLEKELQKLSDQLEKLKLQLNNPEFISKAPPELIQKQRSQLSSQEHELKQIQEKLLKLSLN